MSLGAPTLPPRYDFAAWVYKKALVDAGLELAVRQGIEELRVEAFTVIRMRKALR